MSKPNKDEKFKRAHRALEVLKILGGEIPNNYDTNSEIIHILVNQEKNNNSYMKVRSDSIEIILENNDHRYHWSRFFDEGSDTVSEKFNVDYRDLSLEFFECDHATLTSGFYLYNGMWGSPKIHCSVNSVSIEDGESKEELPIESYYDAFLSYMESEKEGYGCALANDPVIIDIIVRMFEEPIKNHVSDLINNDQSWRFESEKETIQSNYSESVERYTNLFKREIEDATMVYTEQLRSNAEIKEENFRKLEETRGRYLHKSKKGPLV